MITIIRYRFSDGNWVYDYYDKTDLYLDSMIQPRRWAYPIGITSYPLVARMRARFRSSKDTINETRDEQT